MAVSGNPSASPPASTHNTRAARSIVLTAGSVSDVSVFMFMRSLFGAHVRLATLTATVALRQCSVNRRCVFHNMEQYGIVNLEKRSAPSGGRTEIYESQTTHVR